MGPHLEIGSLQMDGSCLRAVREVVLSPLDVTLLLYGWDTRALWPSAPGL
jgi:hypothetical protein